MENYDKELKTKLSNIKNVLNVNDVLARDGGTDSIRKYYKLNKLAYSIFHSKKGFVHAGLSESDSFKDEDLLAQPKIIGKYIEENNAKKSWSSLWEKVQTVNTWQRNIQMLIFMVWI